MPRPKNAWPSYRKHSSGQARVTINGRDHLLGPFGSKESRLEYDRVIGEWLAAGRSTQYGKPAHDCTVAALLLDYIRHAKVYYGASKRGEYANMKSACRLLEMYHRFPATEFGPAQFKAVRQKLIENGRTRSGINGQMARIIRIFKWGASEGLIATSVYLTLKTVEPLKAGRTEAAEKPPVEPVAASVVEATVKHLPPVVGDMVRVQLLLGCRPAEVCALTPGMIDQSGDVWVARLAKHKTAHHGKKRAIAIGPRAQEILWLYLNRSPDACLFSPAESEAKRREAIERTTPANQGNRPGYSARVRSGRWAKWQPGNAYDTVSYARAITRTCEANGIKHWSPNQLRHARATLIRAMFGIEAAAVALGHAKVDTTEIYAQADLEKAVKVAREIG